MTVSYEEFDAQSLKKQIALYTKRENARMRSDFVREMIECIPECGDSPSISFDTWKYSVSKTDLNRFYNELKNKGFTVSYDGQYIDISI